LQGLAVGERVGLYLSAAPIWWPALLACLRLGLTFVPLEPDFPVERLQGIARQARLSAVICDGDRPAPPRLSAAHPRRAGSGGAVSWPQVDDALAAYMMFTSAPPASPRGGHQPAGPALLPRRDP
jgi:non-ribosomal peptide synthetase component F